MVKTQAPDDVPVASGQTFIADAIPDAFDERDLPYVPRLQPLPPVLDRRRNARVLTQQGSSCTGHAVAAMVNTVLARPELATRTGRATATTRRVSPYMLYHLARRYDEFAGEADIGSSLRGAFKGWMRHGLALEEDWSSLDGEALDLDDADVRAKCGERPLGAYFRVNVQRLDDMQSAINELGAIAVSAAIHTGWSEPIAMTRPGVPKPILVIRRGQDDRPNGGHAFAIVGYNRVGFLVQNSWGTAWGRKGFATLPYEDWLESAYDAWVARPGVPATPPYRLRNKTVHTTGGGLAQAPGPDVRRLIPYVVNLGDDGKLSTSGRMTSSPRQVAGIVETMARQHAAWAAASGNPSTFRRRIVLYAHGGLVNEMGGLSTAERQLNWWLHNEVYPVSFAWESGAVETVLSAMKDLFGVRLPFGGIFEDAQERWDRFVEGKARQLVSPLWQVMKANGREASAPLSGSPDFGAPQSDEPGASLFVECLRRYIATAPAGAVEVHLVGHSAGSVFLGALLNRLLAAGIRVESMQLLGAAMTAKEFDETVVPHLGNGLARFTAFNLSERAEQDDSCPGGPVTLYFKSLLYFVARSLEPLPALNVRETPMVGLESSLGQPFVAGDPRRLGDVIDVTRRVIAPTPTGAGQPDPDSRSQARGHGDLDNDPDTLTSVLLRVLNQKVLAGIRPYRAHAPAPVGIVGAVAVGPPIAQEEAGRVEPVDLADELAAGVGADSLPTPVASSLKASEAPAAEEAPTTPSESIDEPLAYADLLEADGWTSLASAAETPPASGEEATMPA